MIKTFTGKEFNVLFKHKNLRRMTDGEDELGWMKLYTRRD